MDAAELLETCAALFHFHAFDRSQSIAGPQKPPEQVAIDWVVLYNQNPDWRGFHCARFLS
jgi:hypothetical protein